MGEKIDFSELKRRREKRLSLEKIKGYGDAVLSNIRSAKKAGSLEPVNIPDVPLEPEQATVIDITKRLEQRGSPDSPDAG